MSDALRDALLRALLNCIASLELSDDELIDPGLASDILGDVVTDLDVLTDSDQALLAELIRQQAATERDPARRKVFEDGPEDLGLVDNEPD